ncbi:MAG: haloalkane dehalogenase [Thermotogota bacterium]|nr:haloalkane dehalogenase [Thermotogota bacterium]
MRKTATTMIVLLICSTIMLAAFLNTDIKVFALTDEALEIYTTADGVDFVRTPDAFFVDLPDWPYEAKYVEIDGLRQAYVDEGSGESGETILLLHGQPSWSYLYRKMIPWLVDEGHRVIAMDHLGMGRSDKPVELDYHSYDNHVYRLEQFIIKLGLRDITAFVQDWGSLIGLNVIGNHPDWFARVAVGDGALPPVPEGVVMFPLPEDEEEAIESFKKRIGLIPAQQPEFYDENGNLKALLRFSRNDNYFGNWILFSRKAEDFRASTIVEAMTYFPLFEAERDAYDAPFPARITMAAPRSFPGLANTLGGKTSSAIEGLKAYEKPFLTIWASNDPGNLGTKETQQILIDWVPGAQGQNHTRLPEASHFLQDDQGAEIAQRINQFIASTKEKDPQTSERLNRYCEFLCAYLDNGKIQHIDVWNTVNFNSCPDFAWSERDLSVIKNELKASRIGDNGPRYWVNDKVESLDENPDKGFEVRQFGDILMAKVATLERSFSIGMLSFENFYTPNTVMRNTSYTYFSDDWVFTLTDSDGQVYVMQSFSQQVNPDLTYENLHHLEDVLNLPEGWYYEPVLLEEELILESHGETTVVSDDFRNVYQIVPGGLS